jgi:hypothetical protein
MVMGMVVNMVKEKSNGEIKMEMDMEMEQLCQQQ